MVSQRRKGFCVPCGRLNQSPVVPAWSRAPILLARKLGIRNNVGTLYDRSRVVLRVLLRVRSTSGRYPL